MDDPEGRADLIRVRNWEKWQSYRRDRGQPPWIKVHREVMRNPQWVALTDAQRGQLVAMWLLAADRDGYLPSSPSLIRKLCYMDSDPDLEVFVQHGFIEPGANVTSQRRQDDGGMTLARTRSREAEAEAEEKQRTTRARKKKRAIVYSPEFSEVWAIHPRGPKEKAQTEYVGAVPSSIEHAELLRLLDSYVATEINERFKGHDLFRWLRDERWEQERAKTNGKPKGEPVAEGSAARFYR